MISMAIMIPLNRFDRTRNASKGVTGLFNKRKSPVAILALSLSLLLWGGIWWLASYSIGVSFILPSPFEAFKAFFGLLTEKHFYTALLGSLGRIGSGYLLGVVIGTVFAFAGHFVPPIKVFLSPIIKIARATPVASFILICALWMNSSTTPIFISLLMVFPIVYENTLTGLQNTDRLLYEVSVAYRFSPLKRLRLLYLPSVAP